MSNLLHFYRDKIIKSINIESIIFFDNSKFERGTLINTDALNEKNFEKYIFSIYYIFKISKQNMTINNLRLIYLYSNDGVIVNIYKLEVEKETNENDSLYNFNGYYKIIESKYDSNFKVLSNTLNYQNIPMNKFNVTSTSIENDNIVFTIDNLNNLNNLTYIYAFLEENETFIYPDSYFQIITINYEESKIICTKIINKAIDELNISSYNFRNISTDIFISEAKIVNSDVLSNYLFIENSISNVVNSYSKSQYMDYVRNINYNLVQTNFYIIKNLINTFFTEKLFMSRYFTVNQETKVIDGNSLKNLLLESALTSFTNSKFKKNDNEIFSSNDFFKYSLLSKYKGIYSKFIEDILLSWSSSVILSVPANNYSAFFNIIAQTEYLKNNSPEITIVLNGLFLNDGINLRLSNL